MKIKDMIKQSPGPKGLILKNGRVAMSILGVHTLNTIDPHENLDVLIDTLVSRLHTSSPCADRLFGRGSDISEA